MVTVAPQIGAEMLETKPKTLNPHTRAQGYQTGGGAAGYGQPPAEAQGAGRWAPPAGQHVHSSWQQNMEYQISGGQQGAAAPAQAYGAQCYGAPSTAAAPGGQGYSANPAWAAATQLQNQPSGAPTEEPWAVHYQGGGMR